MRLPHGSSDQRNLDERHARKHPGMKSKGLRYRRHQRDLPFAAVTIVISIVATNTFRFKPRPRLQDAQTRHPPTHKPRGVFMGTAEFKIRRHPFAGNCSIVIKSLAATTSRLPPRRRSRVALAAFRSTHWTTYFIGLHSLHTCRASPGHHRSCARN